MPLIPNGDQMRDWSSSFSLAVGVSDDDDTAVGWVERSLIDSACYKN